MPTLAIGFLDGGVHHSQHGGGDVDADPVTLDIRNDRIVGDVQRRIGIDGDLAALGRDNDVLVLHAATCCLLPDSSGARFYTAVPRYGGDGVTAQGTVIPRRPVGASWDFLHFVSVTLRLLARRLWLRSAMSMASSSACSWFSRGSTDDR